MSKKLDPHISELSKLLLLCSNDLLKSYLSLSLLSLLCSNDYKRKLESFNYNYLYTQIERIVNSDPDELELLLELGKKLVEIIMMEKIEILAFKSLSLPNLFTHLLKVFSANFNQAYLLRLTELLISLLSAIHNYNLFYYQDLINGCIDLWNDLESCKTLSFNPQIKIQAFHDLYILLEKDLPQLYYITTIDSLNYLQTCLFKLLTFSSQIDCFKGEIILSIGITALNNYLNLNRNDDAIISLFCITQLIQIANCTINLNDFNPLIRKIFSKHIGTSESLDDMVSVFLLHYFNKIDLHDSLNLIEFILIAGPEALKITDSSYLKVSLCVLLTDFFCHFKQLNFHAYNLIDLLLNKPYSHSLIVIRIFDYITWDEEIRHPPKSFKSNSGKGKCFTIFNRESVLDIFKSKIGTIKFILSNLTSNEDSYRLNIENFTTLYQPVSNAFLIFRQMPENELYYFGLDSYFDLFKSFLSELHNYLNLFCNTLNSFNNDNLNKFIELYSQFAEFLFINKKFFKFEKQLDWLKGFLKPSILINFFDKIGVKIIPILKSSLLVSIWCQEYTDIDSSELIALYLNSSSTFLNIVAIELLPLFCLSKNSDAILPWLSSLVKMLNTNHVDTNIDLNGTWYSTLFNSIRQLICYSSCDPVKSDLEFNPEIAYFSDKNIAISSLKVVFENCGFTNKLNQSLTYKTYTFPTRDSFLALTKCKVCDGLPKSYQDTIKTLSLSLISPVFQFYIMNSKLKNLSYSLISLIFSLLLHCNLSTNTSLEFCNQALEFVEECMYSDSKIVRDIASSRLPSLFCGNEKVLPSILSTIKPDPARSTQIMSVMDAVSYFSERMEKSDKYNIEIRRSMLQAIGGLASLGNDYEGYFLLCLLIHFNDKDYLLRVKAYEQIIQLAGSRTLIELIRRHSYFLYTSILQVPNLIKTICEILRWDQIDFYNECQQLIPSMIILRREICLQQLCRLKNIKLKELFSPHIQSTLARVFWRLDSNTMDITENLDVSNINISQSEWVKVITPHLEYSSRIYLNKNNVKGLISLHSRESLYFELWKSTYFSSSNQVECAVINQNLLRSLWLCIHGDFNCEIDLKELSEYYKNCFLYLVDNTCEQGDKNFSAIISCLSSIFFICRYSLALFLPKIVTIFSTLTANYTTDNVLFLSNEANFEICKLKIVTLWKELLTYFKENNNLQSIGGSLTQIVMRICLLCKSEDESVSANAARTLLNWLLFDHKDLWSHYWKELPTIPEHPILEAVRNWVLQLQEQLDLAGKIDYMLLQVGHESPQVRTSALQNLIEIIRNSKSEFESLLNSNKSNFVTTFLSKILSLCSDSWKACSLSAASLVGEIGAIDPSYFINFKGQKLDVSSPHTISRVHFVHQDAPLSFFDLCDHILSNFIALSLKHDISNKMNILLCGGKQFLTYLNADLKTVKKYSIILESAAGDTIVASKIIYNDFMKVSNAKGSPEFKNMVGLYLWSCLSKDTKNSLEMTLASNYTSKLIDEPQIGNSLIYFPKMKCHDFFFSLTKLLTQFLSLTEADFCKSLTMIFKGQLSALQFILPYLFMAVIISKIERNLLRLRDEILNVMKQIESKNPISMILFDTLDILSKWNNFGYNSNPFIPPNSLIEKRIFIPASAQDEVRDMDLEFSKNIDRKIGIFTVVHSPVDRDKNHEAVNSFLGTLPNILLAHFAFKSELFARSLRYLETHYKEIQVNDPKQHTPLFASENSESELLHSLYLNLDLTDSIDGLTSLSSLSSSIINNNSANAYASNLIQETKSLEALSQWSDAFVSYSQAVSLYPDIKPFQIGLIKSMTQVGMYKQAISHVKSSNSNFKLELQKEVIGSCWRSESWDDIEAFLKEVEKPNSTSFEVGIGNLLLKAHSNYPKWNLDLMEIRRSVCNLLADASLESYNMAYPYIVQLHMLTEIEHYFTFRNNGGDQLWCSRTRLQRTQALFRVREPIISLRRVLHSLSNNLNLVGENWLLLSKEARKAEQKIPSSSFLIQAANYSLPMFAIQKAKLLYFNGEYHKAFKIVEDYIKDLSVPSPASLGILNSISFFNIDARLHSPIEVSQDLFFRKGKAYLILARWHEIAGIKSSKDILELYENSIRSFYGCSEKSHFLMAKFHDHLHRRAMRQAILPHHTQSDNENSTSNSSNQYLNWTSEKSSLAILQNSKEATLNILHHLEKTLTHYATSLSCGHKYVFESLPRYLTLWFEYNDQVQCLTAYMNATNKTHKKRGEFKFEEPNVIKKLREFMNNCALEHPSYQWMTVLPQLLSRIAHPDPNILLFITTIVERLFNSYTDQTSWMVLPLTNYKKPEIHSKVRAMVNKITNSNPNLTKVLRLLNELVDGILLLCTEQPPPSISGRQRTYELNKKTHFKLLNSMARLSELNKNPIIPLLSSLIVNLPSSGVKDLKFKGYDESLPRIKDFEKNIEVLKSKEKPKKITITGSDGKLYMFLCKREEKGDTRKNSRMMEFASVMNQLFLLDPEARRRSALLLCTYTVLPMTEDTCIIEWVPSTTTFRSVLFDLQKKKGLNHDFGLIRAWYDECDERDSSGNIVRSIAKEIRLFKKMKDLFRPIFYQWFLANFFDPSTWLQSRTNFTHSTASWSMVGSILGLGDRHGENLLLNWSNGSMVQVDFDCLFEKGLTLSVPERVPFRLTQNIIDGFGITGVEGDFRRSCEVTIKVLHSKRDLLLNVLQSFINDPLVEWEKTGLMTVQDMAFLHMQKLENKLRGQVSADSIALKFKGHSDHLIKEATSESNLARMYIGWMPWL